MVSADLDVELATLVGEMEDQPCESVDHQYAVVHDDGPATHYARVHCERCSFCAIKSYCETFVHAIATEPLAKCHECGAVTRASKLITILGPVKP